MAETEPKEAREHRVVGEARWPMAVAVLAVIVMTILLPNSLIARPRWGVPLVEGLLLVAVMIGDPGKIDRRSRTVRTLSVTLIALLVGTTLWCTTQLIAELIQGGPATSSGGALLAAGGIVWLSNCLAFGLLYWELDSGGPAVRAHGLPAHPDFAFPQQLSPELAPKDWRPQFVDYMYLGFTSATAFSPTDIMPLRAWNKIAMMAQSAISLALLGLVIARAVNVLQ
ncbi:MAG: hypothetical protein NTW58_11400 [Actinobacteria bacterium]|nr:hypothetical protein [Actinomycetota bacterium]